MKIFPNKFKPIQYIKDDAYLIHAIIPIVDITDATAMKNWLGVDKAFRQNSIGSYLFVEKIDGAEFEEIE